MIKTQARGYSRGFYLAAVAAWTVSVGLMFITAVWGGFYGMVEAMNAAREAKHLARSLPADPSHGQPAPGHLSPKPFEHAQPAPAAPQGWAVSEAVRGVQALELRLEKLQDWLLEPDRPQPPAPAPRAQTGAAQPVTTEVRQELPPPPARSAQPPLLQGEAGVVKTAKFEPGEGRFQMTLQTTAPPEKVSFFFLDNPRRLAVNLQGAWRNTAPRSTEFKTGPIARANVGEHPDYVRVTLVFKDPNAPKPADPVITKTKDGFGLVLTTK